MAVRSVLGLALAAGTALAAYRLAVLNASTNVLDYAGADDAAPFVTTDTVVEAGDIQSVERLGDGTTHKVTASKAIARGAVLYSAASGKVTDAPNGKPRGIALAAASGDGSVIEMVPMPAAVSALGVRTLAATGDVTLTTADLDKLILLPSTGAQAITLPATADCSGRGFIFKKTTANAVAATLTPASGTIDGAATNAQIDAAQDMLHIISDGTNWHIVAAKIA